MTSDENEVVQLLAAAGLPAEPDEIRTLAQGLPRFRARLKALWALDCDDLALTFSADPPSHTWPAE